MTKAILFDCGGVFVAPTTGDWLLGPGFEEVLGEDFIAEKLDLFRKTRAPFIHMIPDANRLDTDAEEYDMFLVFYRAVFDAMGQPVSEEGIKRLAWLQVYRDDRYILFDDVLSYLGKWKERYKLGIVSDAPPSTRRIMRSMGVLPFMDGATFSCDLGVLKPDARIFQSTLSQLSIKPKEAVYIDDFPSKLAGAVALGIPSFQMRRPMPETFRLPSLWDGPVVEDFAALDRALEGR